MNSETKDKYLQLIRSGYGRLGVSEPYQLPAKALFRILFALQLLYRDLLPEDFAFGVPGTVELTRYDIREKCCANVDPVGATLCFLILDATGRLNSFPPEPTLQRTLASNLSLCRQSDAELVRDVIHQTLQLSLHLGIDGRTRIRKSAELRRFFMYRICLEAKQTIGNNAHERLTSARTEIEANYKTNFTQKGTLRKSSVFSENWLANSIERKAPWTVMSWLENLGFQTKARIRSALRRAKRSDSEADPEEDQKEDSSDIELSENREIINCYGREQYLSDVRRASMSYPGPCPTPSALSESIVIQIITACVRCDEPGPTLISVMCCALAGEESIRRIKFHRRPDRWVVSTPVFPPNKLPKAKGVRKILRKAHNRFYRVIPAELYKRFRRLKRRIGYDKMVEHAKVWLRKRWPDANPTLRKLERALYINGPSWFKYPWIYAYLGIEGWKEKGHAAKSYSNVAEPIRNQTLVYLEAFFKMNPCESPKNLPPTGSALVPEDTVVSTILRRLDYLVGLKTPTQSTCILGRLMVVSAAAHLAFTLFTGIRNTPMSAPSIRMLHPAGDWELIEQKGAMVACYVPEALRLILRRTHDCVEACLKSLRANDVIVDGAFAGAIYGFATLDVQLGRITYKDPCHYLVIAGFLADKELSQYCNLPRTSFRQWTNTKLRESGQFNEIEIRGFVGHYESVLHAFRRHRQELIIDRPLRERIANYLASCAGV